MATFRTKLDHLLGWRKHLHAIEIVEVYKDFEPPCDLPPLVRYALRVVPDKYLAGLNQIVLRDSATLSRDQRRRTMHSRGRKVQGNDALGIYRHAWNGERPFITLYVDKLLDKDYTKFPIVTSQRVLGHLSRTLFHEVGHHIHKTKVPEYRECENVADRYMWGFYLSFMMRNLPFFFLALGAHFVCHPTHIVWFAKKIWNHRSESKGG
jgi:hypothetical protein